MTIQFEVMKYLKNFFETGKVVSGVVTIAGGQVQGIDDYVLPGQFYMISGSIFNDGCYRHGEENLTDEMFTGQIIPQRIPRDFLDLCAEIDEWQTKNGDASPYQSESFGGYSYSKAWNADGSAKSWREAFGKRLAVWRKL